MSLKRSVSLLEGEWRALLLEECNEVEEEEEATMVGLVFFVMKDSRSDRSSSQRGGLEFWKRNRITWVVK